MSCNQLALTSDIHQANLNKVERGLRQVTDDMLAKLAPVLGIAFEDLKREALRDRLDHQELEAAAEIIAEESTPEEWVRIHQRAGKRTPEEDAKFWEAIRAVAEAELKLQEEERGGTANA